MYGTFHSHTTFSDGRFSVENLLLKFKQKKITHCAISDHDNAGAFPQAFEIADSFGLKIFAGLEFSSQFKHYSECHILGLRIDYKNKLINDYETRILGGRKKRAELIVSKMTDMGIQLEPDTVIDLYNNPSIGRPHIAKILIDKKAVSNTAEAFGTYLNPGKPLYVKKDQIAADEVIKLIHQLGGLAVLAHPAHFFTEEDVRELVGFGLDGLEVIHPMHRRKISKQWRSFAEKNDLIISGGSDFHGIEKSEEKNIVRYRLEGEDLKNFLKKLES